MENRIKEGGRRKERVWKESFNSEGSTVRSEQFWKLILIVITRMNTARWKAQRKLGRYLTLHQEITRNSEHNAEKCYRCSHADTIFRCVVRLEK